MRDPKRIPAILKKLGDEWKKHPDMRLGQLLVNAATGVVGHSPTRADIFRMEDAELVKWLEAGGMDGEEKT